MFFVFLFNQQHQVFPSSLILFQDEITFRKNYENNFHDNLTQQNEFSINPRKGKEQTHSRFSEYLRNRTALLKGILYISRIVNVIVFKGSKLESFGDQSLRITI